MKKRILFKLLSPFFAFLSIQALAQPTLTIAETYTGGDSARLVNCLGLFLAPGPAGANQSWDFSLLLPLDTVTQHVDTVGGPSNVKLTTGNAASTFLRITQTRTSVIGLTVGTSDITYDPGAQVMRRPLGYQDTYNNTFDTDVQADQYHLTGTGKNTILADAWGTLKTPMGTFENVMRVFIHHHETNQLAVLTQNTDIFSYVWYAVNNNRPIFRIDSTSFTGNLLDTQSVTAQYLLIETPDAVTTTNKASIKAAAHYGNGEILVRGNFEAGKQYQIAVMSMDGKKIYESVFSSSNGTASFRPGITAANGMYLIMLAEVNSMQAPTLIKVIKE